MSKKEKIKAIIMAVTLSLLLVQKAFEIRNLISEHEKQKESVA